MVATEQILSVAQMQAAEQAIIDDGSSVEELMQIAGEGAAEYIWRASGGRSTTILCGPGNNGGDGYVIAESLRRKGCEVEVIAPMPPKTKAAKAACENYAGIIAPDSTGRSGECFVDCLFGSGLTRPLDDTLSELLKNAAAKHNLSIAVDLPSGIESDSGAVLNADIPEYDLTLALGAWKFAHFLSPAVAHISRKRLVPIGVRDVPNAAQRLNRPHIHAPRATDHKYTRGMVAVAGGSMPGAAQLSSLSASKSGAGYVKLLGPRSGGCAEHIVADKTPFADAIQDHRIGALLVGPGLGLDDYAARTVEAALQSNLPSVFDADALHILREKSNGAPTIATPHEGELAAMERSFGLASDTNKVERASRLAHATGCVVVAKGPDTIIADPETDHIAIADNSSSWLSTAGTGDVLAGIIASRLAVTKDPFGSACEGVWLHSEAGRLAGPAFTAADLIDHIPGALEQCL